MLAGMQGQTASLGLPSAAPSQPSAMMDYVQRQAEFLTRFGHAVQSVEGLLDKLRGARPTEVQRNDKEAPTHGLAGTLLRQHEMGLALQQRLELALGELHGFI